VNENVAIPHAHWHMGCARPPACFIRSIIERIILITMRHHHHHHQQQQQQQQYRPP
jgi:hypothetical protein